MYVFAGTFEATLDEKHRVVLPLGMRKCIRENLEKLIERGFMAVPSDRNQFVLLYPVDEYDRFVSVLEARYELADQAGQDYLRRFTSSAMAIELDRQYRFMVPDAIREAVQLPREVYFVGRTRRIEIWPKDLWIRWREETKDMTIRAPSSPSPPAGG